MSKIFLFMMICLIDYPILDKSLTSSISNHIFIDTVRKDTLNIDTLSIQKSLTAEQKYKRNQHTNRTAYLWGDNKKIAKTNPKGGMLFSINKLYSHFTKKGKQSRRLIRFFENDYDQDKIERLWKPLTVDLTKLKGDSLFYFQMYFQPSSEFLETSEYHEKVAYVVKAMRVYRDSTEYIHQKMRLPKIDAILDKEKRGNK